MNAYELAFLQVVAGFFGIFMGYIVSQIWFYTNSKNKTNKWK